MAKQRSRSAEATIRGFMYQFDATILKILEAKTKESIVVEGIEDVDVLGADRVEAIQCKYYEGTSLTNAVLREIVKPMLRHFKTEVRGISYFIYGHFKSTHDFPLDDPAKFKSEVLAYTKKDVAGNVADDLEITTSKLGEFLKCLNFEYTGSFDEHQAKVATQLEDVLNCSADEISCLYYPNAMSVVESLAVQSNDANRIITKKKFLQRINVKKILYSRWCLEEEGREKFFKKVKKQHFSPLNVLPLNRFLIIEVSDQTKLSDLKSVLLRVGKSLSTASKGRRTRDRFAPFVCIRNLAGSDFVSLKNKLYGEGHRFVDGFPFRDASFQFCDLLLPQTEENKLAFRFVDEELLDDAIGRVTGTKEVYEFFHSQPMKEREDVKHIQIPMKEVNDIGLIV